MKKIKSIIVDDERFAIENLKDLLTEFCPEVEIVAEAQNIASAESVMRMYNFDVLFLDISLGNTTSFELLNKLYYDTTFQKTFQLIFITAYDKHALQAFRLNAVDYILKPISAEILVESIHKIKKNINYDSDNNLLNIITNNTFRKTITIPFKDAWEIIPVDDIMFIEADRAYSKIYTLNNREMYTSRSLREQESSLYNNKQFIRIHKSFIVNVNFILKIIKSNGGYLELTNGKQIPISNGLKKDFYTSFL